MTNRDAFGSLFIIIVTTPPYGDEKSFVPPKFLPNSLLTVITTLIFWCSFLGLLHNNGAWAPCRKIYDLFLFRVYLIQNDISLFWFYYVRFPFQLYVVGSHPDSQSVFHFSRWIFSRSAGANAWNQLVIITTSEITNSPSRMWGRQNWPCCIFPKWKITGPNSIVCIHLSRNNLSSSFVTSSIKAKENIKYQKDLNFLSLSSTKNEKEMRLNVKRSTYCFASSVVARPQH